MAVGSVSTGVASPEPELLPRHCLGKEGRDAEPQPVGSRVESLPSTAPKVHGDKTYEACPSQ